jgi:hypothetical protein
MPTQVRRYPHECCGLISQPQQADKKLTNADKNVRKINDLRHLTAGTPSAYWVASPDEWGTTFT